MKFLIVACYFFSKISAYIFFAYCEHSAECEKYRSQYKNVKHFKYLKGINYEVRIVQGTSLSK